MDFEDDDLTEEFETVTMTGDNGEDIEFVIIDSVEDSGDKYLLVVESEYMDDDETEAVILKEIAGDNETSTYELVEDGIEFDRAAELFQNSGSGEYDVEIEEF